MKAVTLLRERMQAATAQSLIPPRAGARDRPHPPNDHAIVWLLEFLGAYGYTPHPPDQWDDVTQEALSGALTRFQRAYDLPPSGVVTARTVRAALTPRCGCPDVVRPWHSHARLRAFVRENLTGWKKRGLRFRVDGVPPGLSRAAFEEVVLRAFRSWTVHGNLDVAPAAAGTPVDISVQTGRGAASNFDGPGGVLAWAYLPSGDDRTLVMKFDADETWLLPDAAAGRGIKLLNVCAHEGGHLFGLDHSRKAAALMYPTYNVDIAVPQPDDDVSRFVSLYGQRPAPPPTPTPDDVGRLTAHMNAIGQHVDLYRQGK